MVQKTNFSPKKAGQPIFLVLSGLVAIFSTASIFFQLGGTFAYNLAPILAALLSVYAAFKLLKFNFNLGDRKIGKVHFLFAGIASWAIAEGVWMIYDTFFGSEDFVVTWADFFWYLGYPLLIAYLFLRILPILSSFSRRGKITYFVAFVATMLLSWYALTTLLLNNPDLSTAEILAAVGYVILDAVVVFLSGSTLIFFRGGALAKSQALVLAGFALSGISDMLYYYLGALGIYSTGNLIDLGWVISYVLIGIGLAYELAELRKTI
ncbi:MAG: hypothetical protein V1820_04440 [archaeon]